MNDILGRTLKLGQFVLFSRKVEGYESMAAGVIISFRTNTSNLHKDRIEVADILSAEYYVKTASWGKALKLMTIPIRKLYITNDFPKEVGDRLKYASKIF